MTRWILRRFKHICAKANRKAKRNGHAAVPLLFAQKEPPRAAKGFNWIVRDCCLCALIRGLQNLESPLKGFNCCGAKLRLQCADARFAKPRISLQRERVVTFCVVQKVTKKHTGRSPATSIQSSVEENFSIASGGTSRTRLFVQIGGEKALNRCEVRALQRKNLERRLKEQRCSLRTVGYGWVGMGSGGQNRTAFSAHARQCKNEKPFINPPRQQLPTAPKLTCNSPFRIAFATVSLQQNNSFSKLRSLASDVRPPFRTDSNPHRRYPEALRFSP